MGSGHPGPAASKRAWPHREDLQCRRPDCTAALCSPPVVLLARWYTKVVLETSTVLLPVTAMALTTGAELFLHIRGGD